MLRKKKWPLLGISFALLISACAPTPPDVPACEHLSQRLENQLPTGHLILTPSPTCMKQIGERECGHCVYIVSGKEIFVGENEKTWLNHKPWSKLKASAVYLPAQESYAPLAAYIIDACKKMDCSDDVDKFKVKLDSLNGVTGAIQNR
jgi:hypothetical protein